MCIKLWPGRVLQHCWGDGMSLMLFAEKKLPPAIVAWLRRAFSAKQRLVLNGIAGSRWLCTLYYAFFSRAFRREQQAVAAGLALHHSRIDPNSMRTLLRRNIHRIEKGLRERLTAQDPTFANDPKRGILLSFCVQGCFYAFTNNSSRMDERHLVDLLAEIARAAQKIKM